MTRTAFENGEKELLCWSHALARYGDSLYSSSDWKPVQISNPDWTPMIYCIDCRARAAGDDTIPPKREEAYHSHATGSWVNGNFYTVPCPTCHGRGECPNMEAHPELHPVPTIVADREKWLVKQGWGVLYDDKACKHPHVRGNGVAPAAMKVEYPGPVCVICDADNRCPECGNIGQIIRPN